MGSVAERLVTRLAAPAKRNYGSTGKAERGAFGIGDSEIALDTDGAMLENSNFGCGHPSNLADRYIAIIRGNVATARNGGWGTLFVPPG